MKSCPLCHRLYTQLMNYCFDDGKSLVEETAAPGSEWVCPNCKARYIKTTRQCQRDGVPLVPLNQLDYYRQRICIECQKVYPEPDKVFCMEDGEKVMARWEIMGLTRTPVASKDAAAPKIAAEAPARDETPVNKEPENLDEPPTARAQPSPSRQLPPQDEIKSLEDNFFQDSHSGIKSPAQGKGFKPQKTSDPTVVLAANAPASELPNHSMGIGKELLTTAPFNYRRKKFNWPIVGKLFAIMVLFGFAFGATLWLKGKSNANNKNEKSKKHQALARPGKKAVPAHEPLSPAKAAKISAAPEATRSSTALEEADIIKSRKARKPSLKTARRRPVPKRRRKSRTLRTTSRYWFRHSATMTAARRFHRRLLESPRRERLSSNQAQDRFHAAVKLYRKGHISTAREAFLKLEQIGLQDRDFKGRVLLNLAHIYRRLKNCSLARRYIIRSMAMLPHASSLQNMARKVKKQIDQQCPLKTY